MHIFSFYAINIAKHHNMIHRTREITDLCWVKKKRSTSLLATRTDGVKKKCMSPSVSSLNRKVFVSQKTHKKRPHTFTRQQLADAQSQEALVQRQMTKVEMIWCCLSVQHTTSASPHTSEKPRGIFMILD